MDNMTLHEVMVHQQILRQREATTQVQRRPTSSAAGSLEIRELNGRLHRLMTTLRGLRMRRSNGPNKRKVESLIDFEKGMKEILIIDGEDVCGICLEETKVEDEVRVMECSHLFHFNCISEWIKRKPNCPICRHDMPVINQSPLKRRKLSRS